MRKSDKPTKSQMEAQAKRLGLAVPPTEWGLTRIFMHVGWPTADEHKVANLKEWQTKWIGKSVKGGANEKALGKFADKTGTVMAVVPCTQNMRTHKDMPRLAGDPTPTEHRARYEGLIKWDGGNTGYAPLLYFSITE